MAKVLSNPVVQGLSGSLGARSCASSRRQLSVVTPFLTHSIHHSRENGCLNPFAFLVILVTC